MPSISSLANFFQLFNIVCGIYLIIFPSKLKDPKKWFYLKSSIIVLTYSLLVYGFITSDFSIQNVFLNSSTTKPLIYKIAGAWASHEGSIFLWLTIMSLVSSCFLHVNSMTPSLITTQIRILAGIDLLFSSFIYFTSNPFVQLSFYPTQGLGLNPVLQDIALSFHPPILYLGIVSYVVPFTIAITILIHHNLSQNTHIDLLKIAKKFSNLSIFALTLGVGLGSWWAYRELGWGGFWFFDPVENISLLPWLFAIATHHCLLITIKTGRIINWSLDLSIITFLVSIFGTFLVRSGLLTSVHSFSDNSNRSINLFALFIIMSVPSLFLIINNKLVDKPAVNFKTVGMKTAAICFCLSATILLLTIVYPLIYQFFYDINIAIEEKFFVYSFVPIFILILFCAGLFINKQISKKIVYFLLLSTTLTSLTSYKVSHNYLSYLFTIGSIYLITEIINTLIRKSNWFRQSISTSSVSMLLSHFGFALLVLAITFNNLLKQEAEFIGATEESSSFAGYNIILKNVRFASGPNYYRQIAEFWLTDKDNNITILKPENRLYPLEKAISMESDIYSYLTYDLYAVLNKIDDEIIYAQIYYRPFISFIWLSIIIICLGFLIGL